MAKTALITGASSGIGREIAKVLSRKGFKVILCARREKRLNELAQELAGESRVIVCDVSKREECYRLHDEVIDEKISVLVNGAGFGYVGEFNEVPLETELRMIDTNITAVHILTKLFLRDFVKADRGYILNIASSAGLLSGGPMMSTYYASKSYVVDLTSAIYEELKSTHSNVHISALCPGPVDTEFNDVANCKFGVGSISAQYCAAAAVDGMFLKKLIIIPEGKMKLVNVASRLAPRKAMLYFTKDMQDKKVK